MCGRRFRGRGRGRNDSRRRRAATLQAVAHCSKSHPGGHDRNSPCHRYLVNTCHCRAGILKNYKLVGCPHSFGIQSPGAAGMHGTAPAPPGRMYRLAAPHSGGGRGSRPAQSRRRPAARQDGPENAWRASAGRARRPHGPCCARQRRPYQALGGRTRLAGSAVQVVQSGAHGFDVCRVRSP